MTAPSVEPKINAKRRPWLKRWGLVLAVWVGASLFTHWMQEPTRLLDGQIVSKPGRYQFPNHGATIEVRDARDGWIEFTIRPAVRFWKRFVPWRRSGDTSLVEKRRDWFFTVDEYGRVWKFVGGWNPEWDERPSLPSGDSTVNYPTVGVTGPLLIYDGTRVSFGWNSVSSTGEWKGVPQGFFDRLPTEDQWIREHWNAPTRPEPLSATEQMLLRRSTANW